MSSQTAGRADSRTCRAAFASQETDAGRWATATDDRTTRAPGEPGVGLRCYLDLRQPFDS
ncbi:DUF6207 family protein [Streptomyces sp. NPDC001852]|uniref:DUF6207 family protein n=1 Tax=Streptomyces sp. NPDC001852 TaxID=3364619 RepID=UPI0036AB4736